MSQRWLSPLHDLGAPLGLDFEMGAKLAGSRFSVLKGPIARLYRALVLKIFPGSVLVQADR